MIDPRHDGRYDMRVGDEGDQFVNSNQGYENAEDCIAIARRLWPPLKAPTGIGYQNDAAEGHVTVPEDSVAAVIRAMQRGLEPVVMRVTYRDGKTHTEQLR